MTVFKTFFKIVNKYKFVIILYSVMLIIFGGTSLNTKDSTTSFTVTKPDVLIINNDVEKGITKDLISFIEKNSEIVEIEKEEDKINDALFYRDVSYIIYIPNNYREDFLSGKEPTIEVKSTGDYEASLASMLVDEYLDVANIYLDKGYSEDVIIDKVNDVISKDTEIELTSKVDTNSLSYISFYFNFLNYCFLGGCVYVVCLILYCFREEKIRKRTIISSMSYKKLNRELLVSNGILTFVLWLLYIILSVVLFKDMMFTMHGLLYIINSFIFAICALTMAFLIGNIINSKDAVMGIINVVALGSSFLCGAFVPVQMLPEPVLKVAHVLPSYWYIQNNEMIMKLEEINFATLKNYFINIAVVIAFSILFVILSNVIYKKKRKFD